jgi:RNA polymerase sigma-70 factor, ECF subfamily
MHVTANARCRSAAAGSPVRPQFDHRRRLNSNLPSGQDRISKKVGAVICPTIGVKLNEAQAIRRAQNGDASTFEHLYRLHNSRVYAICLRMVKDPTEAEDLTQEAFLLLFRKIRTFRCESAFSTWLHRLTVNCVLMHFRKKSLPTVSIEAPRDPHDQDGSSAIEVATCDLLLEGAVDRINLQRCIKRLPAGYRTVFVLHDVQGYKHQEIAELLGRSIGDSKSQLHKARSHLRKFLQEIQRGKARDGRLAAAKNLNASLAPEYL